MKTLTDFAPEGTESGVGLVLQDTEGRYLFILAGTRENCPPGELFYAGIGGHREVYEDWIACAHREAREEIGTGIDILPVQVTWYVPRQGLIKLVDISDQPRPYMLYEMVHPPGTPRAGEVYRIVIFKARPQENPRDLPLEEVRGIIAMTKEQVAKGLERKPSLSELLEEGALLLPGSVDVDHHWRLFPIGTARALAQLIVQVGEL